MRENDVDTRQKRSNSARPGSVRRELELRGGLVAIGDVLADWFEERGREAHQRAAEARAASAGASTRERVHELAETIARAEELNHKCAQAVHMVRRDLPVVSLARMLAEMDRDDDIGRRVDPTIKGACEACGDTHGPWGLSRTKRFLCEGCLDATTHLEGDR